MSEPLVIWRLTDGKPGHMQQTLGLTTPGVGTCKPNPYPYP